MHFYASVLSRIFPLAVLVIASYQAAAQTYPYRPIRMVGPEAGGGGDLVARVIAQNLSDPLGQRVIVDNRAGVVAAETVAKAPSDGYTLLLYSNPLWLLPLFQSNISWNPLKDFSPVTLATNSPNLLVVHPSFPAASVKELIGQAKAKPGGFNYASSPAGSSTHIAAEMFKYMAGVDLLRVPYRGNAAALNAVLGGEAQIMFPNAGAVSPHIKSRGLRALAITSAQPSKLFPGLPTVAGSGLPGYESLTIIGIFAPARTPPAVVEHLSKAIAAVLNRSDVKDKFATFGVESVGSSPSEFAFAIKDEMSKTAKLIKETGMKGD